MCEHVEAVRAKYLTQTVRQTFKTNDNGPNEIAHVPDNKRTAKNTTTRHRSTVQFKLNTVSLVKQLLANKH